MVIAGIALGGFWPETVLGFGAIAVFCEDGSPGYLLLQGGLAVVVPGHHRRGEGEALPVVAVTDEAAGSPWAMQLVLRVERAEAPSATAACVAVASAVAQLLADKRATADGEWATRVRHWRHSPRKVVRRARRVAWRRCLDLDGLTVERHGAEVRALPPGPADALPPEVAKLQVGGTDLEDPDR